MGTLSAAARANSPRIDYSQHGQSLILEQLITSDTPRTVVDIGAHDGFSGSNSRGLLEQNWRGLLVEPIPSVFADLKKNSESFPHAVLVEAACSDRDGTARIRLGKGGSDTQMSSLSDAQEVGGNLSSETLEVETTTLATLLREHHIEDDFGVLLVDTEGWDLTVLKGLKETASKPRIIVTEEFEPTNAEKYRFLTDLDYTFVGVWGSDSFWIAPRHKGDFSSLQMPVRRLPATWNPAGRLMSSAQACTDREPISNGCMNLVGWAWCDLPLAPESSSVVLALGRPDSPQHYLFEAWRMPRFDVARHFGAQHLAMSGYRAPINVPPGTYSVTVFQQGDGYYGCTPTGKVQISSDIVPVE